jgi:hypothetical protein
MNKRGGKHVAADTRKTVQADSAAQYDSSLKSDKLIIA